MYPRMGALHMNRSASDGLIRNHPSGQGYEASMHSTENISGEHRARSASGMQEEISYRAGSGQDQQQGVLATRMNETPDFAMIYAFLGSMFDPVSAFCPGLKSRESKLLSDEIILKRCCFRRCHVPSSKMKQCLAAVISQLPLRLLPVHS